ncbi:hypothetical protein HZS55_06415 [Halosimplex rubrum]|uniref:Uncharacterized protein n=1 Tax=Halosimplex rubrum TaxID=869889 RepID=A0A7D5T4G8_9EURY|nr:hypothetical protein [Halosimplex rubrum]QLH76949.1 hypothetical protein HZS55_06415 [Halosimplex rubrum]
MDDADDLDGADEPTYRFTRSLREIGPTVGLLIATLGVFAIDPVSAQTTGEAFCETEMATTIRNMFSLIQFGGPLIGGVIALGTTIALTAIRTVDSKKELKSMRNQAIIWGVIVAPLGTVILQFLLTSVVAGGSSCSF